MDGNIPGFRKHSVNSKNISKQFPKSRKVSQIPESFRDPGKFPGSRKVFTNILTIYTVWVRNNQHRTVVTLKQRIGVRAACRLEVVRWRLCTSNLAFSGPISSETDSVKCYNTSRTPYPRVQEKTERPHPAHHGYAPGRCGFDTVDRSARSVFSWDIEGQNP